MVRTTNSGTLIKMGKIQKDGENWEDSNKWGEMNVYKLKNFQLRTGNTFNMINCLNFDSTSIQL